MTLSLEVWNRGNKKEIWERFCGHLYLNVPTFMRMQENLLMEQIQLLSGCELGRHILGNKVPKNVDEFRAQVPLTDYSSYEPYLSQRNEAVLPKKPRAWICTTGSTGAKKWVPMTQGAHEALVDSFIAILVLAASTGPGEFSLKRGDIVFNSAPPPPWFTGYIIEEVFRKDMGLRLAPPYDEAYLKANLQERTARAFKMAMSNGINVLPGLPSVLVKVGEHFGERKKSPKALLNPAVAARIIRGSEPQRRSSHAPQGPMENRRNHCRGNGFIRLQGQNPQLLGHRPV